MVLPIDNDKIYLIVFIAAVVVAIAFVASLYVKSCVKNELDEIKKDNEKKQKRLIQQQQYEQHRLMVEIERQKQAQKPDEHVQQAINNEQDMDSYMDPIGKEGTNGPEYQDINKKYKSPGGNSGDGILMRDILDNKGMDNKTDK